MTDLIPSRAPGLAEYRDPVRRAVEASRAENTRRAYATAWAMFRAWCEDHGAQPLPAAPETVAAYLTDGATAGRKASTLDLRRAAISAAHRAAGARDPGESEIVVQTMRGLHRAIGTAQHGKSPVAQTELRAMLATLDRETLAGKRDAALILVGFAGGFRRSELAGLDAEHMRAGDDGIRVRIERSKTGEQVKQIPRVGGDVCPVASLRTWMDAAGINSGPVFRRVNRWGGVGRRRLHAQGVADIVKRAAVRAGLDPREYAGHSLRSGFITAALVAGQQSLDVAQQTGHRNLDTLRRYVRDAGFGARRAARAALGG